jgi:hypothetical protein
LAGVVASTAGADPGIEFFLRLAGNHGPIPLESQLLRSKMNKYSLPARR